MRYDLVCHPDYPPLAVQRVAVDLAGDRDDLRLTYRVAGSEQLLLPDVRAAERTDELWRTTCFELFLMAGDGPGYAELNFSPSTQWAAYAFTRYRDSMTSPDLAAVPAIERRADGIAASCDLSGLPAVPLRMALTAVIEEKSGVKSFWALAHAPGAPDFHNPACFVATLPAPGAA